MTARFADRFDPATFADDEPVHIWGVEVLGSDDELWISDRLWSRLCLIGQAYQLHLLPVVASALGPTEPESKFFLNGVQCAQLLDEIELVGSIVDDPLLRDHLAKLARLVRRSSTGTGLGIEHP